MDEKVLSEARKLIAGFLKDRREELKLTQQELADLCGVKRQTIQKIEYGTFLPNMDLFLIMSHHLNCYFFLEAKEGETPNAKTMRERPVNFQNIKIK